MTATYTVKLPGESLSVNLSLVFRCQDMPESDEVYGYSGARTPLFIVIDTPFLVYIGDVLIAVPGARGQTAL